MELSAGLLGGRDLIPLLIMCFVRLLLAIDLVGALLTLTNYSSCHRHKKG